MSIRLLAVGVLVVAALAAPARGEASGEGLYRTYCGSCHGETGRGDGPEAAMFRPAARNLRTGLLERYPAADLVRTVREGAPLALALDPEALRTRANEVEAIVAHLRRLPEVDWDAADRGREIFVERCVACHGPFGVPGSRRPPGVKPPRNLADPVFQRGIDDRDLTTVVRHGRKGMPAIPRLGSDADVRALVAYVRLLSPGYTTYAIYCTSCHGEQGRGEDIVDPGRAPRVRFDRAFLAARDPEQLRVKIWHMLAEQRPAMPHFRRVLSEEQVAAIIGYLEQVK
jgi:mono/diheme cytochrome c family protein